MDYANKRPRISLVEQSPLWHGHSSHSSDCDIPWLCVNIYYQRHQTASPSPYLVYMSHSPSFIDKPERINSREGCALAAWAGMWTQATYSWLGVLTPSPQRHILGTGQNQLLPLKYVPDTWNISFWYGPLDTEANPETLQRMLKRILF